MNYLSHFWFDRDSSDPLFTLGSVLPDLADHFPRTIRNKLRAVDVSVAGSDTLSLLMGVNRHYAIDKIFHESAFFHVETAAIKLQFESLQISNMTKRIYMIAHVMLEIILDRILLLEKKIDGSRFYELLENANGKRLFNALLACRVEQKDIDTLHSKLHRFISYGYLLKYTETRGVVYSLQRIYKWMNPESDLVAGELNEDAEKLGQAVEFISARLKNSYISIFTEIDRQLPKQ